MVGALAGAAQRGREAAAGLVAFSGHGRVEGSTLYVLALEAGALSAWHKAEGDETPFLLGKAAVKAPGYADNPFGAAHVLVDTTHVYFADPGTVDAGQVVPESSGDGAVYRVAK